MLGPDHLSQDLSWEQVGTQESTVRLMLDPLNPVFPPSVTHTFNKHLLSPYCVLGTTDKDFAHMELAVATKKKQENSSIMLFPAVSQVMQWSVSKQPL